MIEKGDKGASGVNVNHAGPFPLTTSAPKAYNVFVGRGFVRRRLIGVVNAATETEAIAQAIQMFRIPLAKQRFVAAFPYNPPLSRAPMRGRTAGPSCPGITPQQDRKA